MSTDVTHHYENKVFPKGQFKQFALKLARYCNISPLDGYILLNRTKDGFETRTLSTIDDSENICEIGTTINRISFHCNYNIIQFSFKSYYNEISILYIINGDVERAKKIIFLTENTLELTRVDKQETKDLILNNSNLININESPTNSLITVWHKALNQLRSLYSIVTYYAWIAPIVPMLNGNQLVLICPNEFAKDWIESRYLNDIKETVHSIEPFIKEIIVRFDCRGILATNRRLLLEIDQPLFDLMNQVYERESENSVECSFDQYFNQVIQSHCQEFNSNN